MIQGLVLTLLCLMIVAILAIIWFAFSSVLAERRAAYYGSKRQQAEFEYAVTREVARQMGIELRSRHE